MYRSLSDAARTFRKLSMGLMSLAAISLAMSQPASAQTRYTVTDLGTLVPGTASGANGISNPVYYYWHGIPQWLLSPTRVAGVSGIGFGNSQTRAFVWDGTQTPALRDLGNASASGVNDGGWTVGTRQVLIYSGNYLTFGTSGVFWDTAGNPQYPGTLGGINSRANAINNYNSVVGSAQTASGVWHAYRWSNGRMYDLYNTSLPNAVSSEAWGINQHNDVVGTVLVRKGVVSPYHQAFLLSSTGYTTLPGTNLDVDSYAWKVNDSQLVVGEWNSSACFWQNGQQKLLKGVGTYSSALGVNNAGKMVGYFETNTVEHAFIADTSRFIQDLNNLIPSNSGWTLVAANAINDYGQIAGTGIAPDGKTHAFLLNPNGF